MRLPPKTTAAAVVLLGMVVATGWQRHRSREKAALASMPEAAVSAGKSEAAPAERRAANEPRAEPARSATPASLTPAREPSSRIALRAPAAQPAPDAEWRRSLAPRTPPPKEALLSPPGRVHQLTLKLSDRLEARAGAAGELLVSADRPEEVAGLARVAEEWRLTFRPVQTATDDALRQLQDRGARRTGRAQPDLGGIVEAVLPEATPERVLAAASALHALAEVEYAEIHSLDAPPPPPGDIAPATPALEGQQTYRGAATGVDVDYVWNTYGIRGAVGLRIADCEYQYRPTHEDLDGLVTMQPGIASMYTAFGDDHGTAVLGILGAGDNGYGMIGAAPACDLLFYPEFSTRASGGTQTRTATVTAAIADSAAGDIVVLEMQIGGVNSAYVPAEYTLSVWTAVKAGADAGVIVVAAAGNGGQNLDSAGYQAYRDRGDSGAIIVGAANPSRERLSFSTYGARVNVQGWGGGVATTGYGTLATYGGDANQKYASSFGGTSSATPVVASAVALVQSVAIEILERRLSPEEMRALLVATGRPQTGSVSQPIGPRPDLAAAVESLLLSEPPGYSALRSWALHQFGTPTPDWQADADGNGIANLVEYVLGTDPKSEPAADIPLHPRVSVIPGAGESRTLRFEFHHPSSRTGAAWAVESAFSLLSPSWTPLVDGVDGVTVSQLGETVRVEIVEAAPKPARFLRLRATAL